MAAAPAAGDRLKQRKRGKTVFRELKRVGADDASARRVAGNTASWWRDSRMLLNRLLPDDYFDRLEVPSFS